MVDVVDGGWWMVDGPSMIHPSQRLVPDSQWLEKAAPVERSSIVSYRPVPYPRSLNLLDSSSYGLTFCGTNHLHYNSLILNLF